MNWDSDKIKELRLRLGWSRSDLARRLHCESEMIHHWEDGSLLPQFEFTQALDLIAKQAEATADEVSSRTAAEAFCDEEHLGQIEMTSLRQRFKSNN